jgi:hypothetical protein
MRGRGEREAYLVLRISYLVGAGPRATPGVEPQGLDILEGRDGDAKKAWFLRGFAPESVFFGIFVVENGGGLGKIECYFF